MVLIFKRKHLFALEEQLTLTIASGAFFGQVFTQ